MMASLGSFTLLAAFVACAYAAAVSVAGARRRSARLIESGEVRRAGTILHLPGHKAKLAAGEQAAS